MLSTEAKKKIFKFVGYMLTVAVGFLLYVLLREYIFTKFNDTGSLESEIEKVSKRLPISDDDGIVTISSLVSDDEYNLTFSISILPEWKFFPNNASRDELLKQLHVTDGRKDTSVLCQQTIVRLAIGEGGMVWVNYSIPGRGIHNEKVRIECSPLET